MAYLALTPTDKFRHLYAVAKNGRTRVVSYSPTRQGYPRQWRMIEVASYLASGTAYPTPEARSRVGVGYQHTSIAAGALCPNLGDRGSARVAAYSTPFLATATALPYLAAAPSKRPCNAYLIRLPIRVAGFLRHTRSDRRLSSTLLHVRQGLLARPVGGG